ncbi:efflux RND transporter periplasmic adaptor subunit [Mesorhizobium sp. M0217]|uniref:efflux RND transporter periplasmic adaptor subunit n=1 Tax=unclassified Mesorhizobium TaxID=325217 RepID=UPI00333CBF18
MRKIMLGVVLLAAMLSACSEEPTATAQVRPIRSAVAEAKDLGETIMQTGEVRPRLETAMSFRLNGQLTYRAETGSTVRAGDIVAAVDKTPSNNNLLTATAEQASAKSAVALAEMTAERSQDLFAKNVTSKAQMQETQANLEAAQARLEVAAATLASAKETLSYTELKAQRDGIISSVAANEGQVVNAGQVVVTLISKEERDAVFDIPERLLALKSSDPVVDVSLISNPDIDARGRVREITPAADASTRTFRVKVALDGASNEMPFGSAVLGKIVLSPKKLFQLPASALTNDGGASAVFVYDRATGKLQYRKVHLERFDDNDLLISAGLSNGDIVATAGVSKLRDGEVVTLEGEAGK